MLKMTIDNEEVVSKNDFTIKEEMLSASSTILNNTYPKSWEDDKDYTSRFYYPKDYAKLNIQNFSIEPEEAGTTIDINGSATLTDVDTTKESRVLKLLGQTSQTTISGKNLFDIATNTSDNYAVNNNISSISGNTMVLNGAGGTSSRVIRLQNQVANKTYTVSFNTDINTNRILVRIRKSDDSGWITNSDITWSGWTYNNTYAAWYYSANASNNKATFTFAVPSGLYWQLGIVNVNSTSATFSNIQLEEGSSATAFVPYVGGTDSPNPQYPQPVNVVSGDNKVNIHGKNWFDIGVSNLDYVNPSGNNPAWLNITNNSINITVQTAGQTCAYRGKKLIGNKTFTISYIQSIEYGRVYLRLRKPDDSGWMTNSDASINGFSYNSYYGGWYSNMSDTSGFTSKTFTIPNCLYWELGIGYDTQTYAGTTQTISNILLEISNQATTYEPYISSTYPIYLGVENLFDVNVIQERTIQGITMTFNEQTIHLQGTATGNANFYMKSGSSFTLEAGTYFITRSSMNGVATLKLSSGSTTIVATGSTDISFILSQATTIDGLTLQVPSSVGTINKDITISIVKGNKAQYISTTPIELCKIGTYQDKIYKGVGSNLFDEDNIGSNSSNSKYYDFTTPLKAGTYTFSCVNTASKRIRIFIGATYDENNYIDVISWSANTSATFTTNDYINRIQINSGSAITITEWQVMFNKGGSLPYEPYNAKDKWLLHKEIGKVVSNGSENWSTRTSSVGQLYELNVASYNFYSTQYESLGFCNQYKPLIYLTEDNTFRILQGITLGIHNDTIGSLANFKNGLANNNLIVYFPLASPMTTEITDTELINQLDALESQ